MTEPSQRRPAQRWSGVCTTALTLGIVLSVVLGAGTNACAEDWPILGARARGMGGAGVATERNQFWNPGSIGMRIPVKRKGTKGSPLSSGTAKRGSDWKQFEFNLDINGHYEMVALGDIIRDIDDIADLYFNTDFAAVQTRLNAGTADANDIQTALQLIEQINDLDDEGKGLYGTIVGNGEAHVHTPAFTLGVFGRYVGYAGADPIVDWSGLGNSAIADGGFGDSFGSIGTFNTPVSTDGQGLSTTLQNSVGGISAAEADELAFQAEQAGLDLSNPGTIAALTKVAQATVDSGVGGLDAGSSLFFNQSGVELKGTLIQEGGVTIATSFELGGVVIAFGVSAKLMQATTNNNLIAVSRFNDGEQVLDKLLDDWNRNEATITTWGVDAGVQARLPGNIMIGVSGKNLNRPVFAFDGPQSYYLTPQGRAGIAWQPIAWVTFAFDADLWATGSRVVDRYHSQFMGGGVEFNLGTDLSAFFFRMGAYRNVAEPNEPVTYSLGVGLHFGPLQIDAAVSASADSAAIENVDDVYDTEDDANWWNLEELYPERFGAGLTVRVTVQF